MLTIKAAQVILNAYGRPIRWIIAYNEGNLSETFEPSGRRSTIWADELPAEITAQIMAMECSHDVTNDDGTTTATYLPA